MDAVPYDRRLVAEAIKGIALLPQKHIGTAVFLGAAVLEEPQPLEKLALPRYSEENEQTLYEAMARQHTRHDVLVKDEYRKLLQEVWCCGVRATVWDLLRTAYVVDPRPEWNQRPAVPFALGTGGVIMDSDYLAAFETEALVHPMRQLYGAAKRYLQSFDAAPHLKAYREEYRGARGPVNSKVKEDAIARINRGLLDAMCEAIPPVAARVEEVWLFMQ